MAGRKQFDETVALDAAMTLFWERGWSATSLDDICAATGLGRGSLYATFGGKDELFRRALQRYSATQGERFDRAIVAHTGDPRAAARAFLDVTLDRIADPTLPGGCLIAMSAAATPSLSEITQQHVRDLVGRQRARFRATFPADANPELADRVSDFVVATNQALAVLDRAGASAETLAGVARTAVDAVPVV